MEQRLNTTAVRGVVLVVVIGTTLLAACNRSEQLPEGSIESYRDRMLASYEEERSSADAASSDAISSPEPLIAQAADPNLPARRTLLIGPENAERPAPEQYLAELPDPSEARETFQRRLEELESVSNERRVISSYNEVVRNALEYIDQIRKPRQVRLTLAECMQATLEHNYAIKVEAFEPAIQTTQLVQAKAAFDAEFFLDASYNQRDPAVIVSSGTEMTDTRTVQGGIRKLLPTGMTASVAMGFNRNYINSRDLPKKTNPSFGFSAVADFRQPLLRNFGLEFNRANIEIARANRDASYWGFVREVRDQMLAVEQAYWTLVRVRRSAAIQAESVAQNYVTWQDLEARKAHDATPVEIANSRARFESRFVDFLDLVRLVRDAEDALINLINDPELLLSDDVEIVPVDPPLSTPVIIDQFREVRTALEERSEIREARLAIQALEIQTSAAKNQTLPQLDLTFQYQVDGAGWSEDNAWDDFAGTNHISYTVGLQFVYPIGNRSRLAQLRASELRELQSIVQLRQLMDAIVQEVNSNVRTIQVTYAQLPVQYSAVKSSERNLRSLQARAQAISPTFLETELNGVEQLANARNRLLQVLTDFNTGLVELEASKGTLLEYNNVALTEPPPKPVSFRPSRGS